MLKKKRNKDVNEYDISGGITQSNRDKQIIFLRINEVFLQNSALFSNGDYIELKQLI